ncbi:hypothetical protein NKH77_27935 [Streptomyces sp. M19]
MVDGVPGAEPADEIEVGGAGQGRDLGAVRRSELDGGVADAARRAPYEQSFAGRSAACRAAR